MRNRDSVRITIGIPSYKCSSGGTFFCFKKQLVTFVDYLKTGKLPFPFDETVELVKIIIAGIRSRDEAGRTVKLSEIK